MTSEDPIPALKERLRERILADVHEWPQEVAAQALGLDQPRMSDLQRGRLERFSLEKTDSNTRSDRSTGGHPRNQCSRGTTANVQISQARSVVMDSGRRKYVPGSVPYGNTSISLEDCLAFNPR